MVEEATSSSPPRPTTARKDPQADMLVPGGFGEDDNASPTTQSPGEDFPTVTAQAPEQFDSSTLPPLPGEDSSLIEHEKDDAFNRTDADMEGKKEKEMRRKLMDFESSFLPSHSPIIQPAGVEDTSLFGIPKGRVDDLQNPSASSPSREEASQVHSPDGGSTKHQSHSQSPETPPESYRTPAPGVEELPMQRSTPSRGHSDLDQGTSSLETMSSSPTAAAAARTISRVISMTTVGGYETADDHMSGRSEHESGEDEDAEEETTPRKHKDASTAREITDAVPPVLSLPSTRHGLSTQESIEINHQGNVNDEPTRNSRRPKFLRSRQASQRSSVGSSISANISSTGESDATLDADLGQSGSDSLQSRHPDLSRSVSLGSIASGVTGLEEGGNVWDRGRTVSGISLQTISSFNTGESNLEPLDEEEQSAQGNSSPRRAKSGEDRAPNGLPPETPRVNPSWIAPTDTVIAHNVRNIQVPESVARDFRDRNRSMSPQKGISGTGGRGKGLTLKEQSSTIDRLQKENWDLKLKIHHLDRALSERSEEGVKQMISENVEMKVGLATLEKQCRGLRKTVHQLEQKLKEQEKSKNEPEGSDTETGSEKVQPELVREMEEEITFWKERVETREVEIEKLRDESGAKETDRRRLAEIVKSLSDRRSADSNLGAREEMDMWKDLYETETSRREQADEDNRKLREEIWRLKNDGSSTTTNNHVRNVYHVKKRQQFTTTQSRSGTSDAMDEPTGASSSASGILVEQLRHENEELRREVGAQTSMLTSRNREKERLYQEIEDLKLRLRGGNGRSIAGDSSIFERSASRAFDRSTSRASDGTRSVALSDSGKEDLENKIGQLRDVNSEMKLQNQELERKLEECLDELDQADVAKADRQREYEEEMELATQDLQTMQRERDEVLQLREELEADFEELKQEAQQEIDNLEAELDQKTEELQRLENELNNKHENFNALQGEMRSMSEGVVRLEDGHTSSSRRIQNLEQELEDANSELESLEKTLREANAKIERFTVQQESSQGEIAFLREEQDGDKIKISDLETALKSTESSVAEEKDRVKELEKQLADERYQREVVGSKEKQEVQKMINNLNRDLSNAKDECKRLRKNLSSREVEATEWKERLTELENNLRVALGDLSGTRSSLLKSVTKLQKELEESVAELESTRNKLSEKERTLRHRDALLESTGLESRRLSDLLDRERQARRSDKHHHEQLQRTTQQTTRTMTQHETRVHELESARQVDRKKISTLESQFKDQLMERNNLLLALWNRLSTLCGTDWAHKYSMVNGRLPSLEVVSSMLPGFSKNLLLAVKTIEGLIGGFKSRIRGVERDLWKEYQSLEHNLDVRVKKLDRLEAIINRGHRSSSSSSSAEVAKLRGENKVLKAEIGVLQKLDTHPQARPKQLEFRSSTGLVPVKNVNRSAVASLARHNSTSAVESLEKYVGYGDNSAMMFPIDTSDQKWIQRLRELERRLKAEREARLMERGGARWKLGETEMVAEDLREELERDRYTLEG
ncbi:MAG: Anucleate primary sterigmata protein B [Piccolia ochrophora]|nr:MAG: Anucleate primary sterigmata protein B [Piccolia ochrophora]